MSDAPTRAQIQQALDCEHVLMVGSCLHDGRAADHQGEVLAAARLWLEGPRVDEAMIYRAAKRLEQAINSEVMPSPWTKQVVPGGDR